MTHKLLQNELEHLMKLITRVHSAKGRYHTQLAMCDLFDAVALPNTRPGHEDPVLAAKSVTADEDPCPGCRKGSFCRTPSCGRLRQARVSDPHESLTFHAIPGEKKMSHINKSLKFLVTARSATFFLSHMWEGIRDERYENAMTSQFLYLAHRDEAQDAMNSMTAEERATLDAMAEIADGEHA